MTPIFQTTDTPLACTLATCGVPFDQDPETGADMPFAHYYSREILLRLGYKGSGLSLDDAARDAWRKGRAGLLVYCFQKVDPFEVVWKAYSRHETAMQGADELAGGVGSQCLTMLPVQPDIAAQICCQFAKNRKALLNGWKTAVPWMHLPGAVETVIEAGQEYRVGSMKLYRLGASAAAKQKIGL